MPKVTNTTNQPLVVGVVEIAAYSTAEIDDAAYNEARLSKATLALFATGKLKLGSSAEREAKLKADAAKKGKLSFAGTPAATIRPKQEKTLPARRGVSTQTAVVRSKLSEHNVPPPPKKQG